MPPLDGRQPVTELQRGHIALLAKLTGDEVTGTAEAMDAMSEGEGAAYVRQAMNKLAQREVVPPVPQAAVQHAKRR